ncbi:MULTISPECIES: glycine betaine ABC transporter substrate-binding protein [Sanguibacteroides]|uniref:Glycine/betaine ABC transporter substrate-binding protein n=1 Tax=Sanguibacteroides justesenii TaxID=1547597 RepID=A0A0C3R6N0_9PORP|nr:MULTISPECIES: glycine betaine ABC transporter substrate-binding protein [Sanguibacteroides]KIO43506.1 glycine/betaine ABC transporter substrate-binding protein [Sanguibacteroides justesenii]KIO45675.1 glycine/betaine ABC transporter substrate-binding protein [Sanguibacteroides justesenii]PXZ45235.1 glycine/betaine ABC transporter substrate-binding protein [Sanguibacteroides justesenii]
MKNSFIAIALSFILLYSCNTPDDTIRIATKPMTEQFILGEMLRLLIEENSDLQVKITKGIGGGTSNIHPAIVKGDFDLYPEYTGTGWLVILKKDSLLPADELYSALQKEYLDKYRLYWIGRYGFNNAYSLAVSNDKARKYHLKTYSDLTRYPDQFIFGAEYDFFEIHDGYDALCKFYDLKFKKTMDMDIGLKYEAIKSNKIDVMNIFTTDGQLSGAELTVLEDDKRFFPTYYCATVVREETLKKHPELKKILMLMDGILTDQEMADLNYQVEIAGNSERDVAANFLQSKGLIKKNKNHGK